MDARTAYAIEYEEMEERAENAYRRLVEGKTCGDCGCCERPESDGFKNPERIGFCTAHMVFKSLDEKVDWEECDCYAKR